MITRELLYAFPAERLQEAQHDPGWREYGVPPAIGSPVRCAPAHQLVWFDFTVPTAWTLPGSIAVIFLALFSSETNDINRYSQPEQVAIGGMLTMVIGWQLLPPDLWATHLPLLGQAVHDMLMAVGSPLTGIIPTAVATTGWAVLVN